MTLRRAILHGLAYVLAGIGGAVGGGIVAVQTAPSHPECVVCRKDRPLIVHYGRDLPRNVQ